MSFFKIIGFIVDISNLKDNNTSLSKHKLKILLFNDKNDYVSKETHKFITSR